ncbi:MAG: NADH-quinone oxidoreductase subunit N [Candidatus Caenarcaniphilales bacterium]|nr:NADH-quinone oxidoreductase subunit N [Candidatus Caenarcaniphilales bacterium]
MDWSIVSKILLPEFIVVFSIILTILLSLFEKTKKYVSAVATVALAIASFVASQTGIGGDVTKILNSAFISDTLCIYLRVLIYGVAALIAMASKKYLDNYESPAEYYPIFLSATLGAGFLAGVNDFLTLFIGLETLGLSAILLASYARKEKKSNESALKYLLTAASATSLLLLAMSFIYGVTASTNFALVASRVAQLQSIGVLSDKLEILIAALLVAAIGFKLAAAPFHNWSPDVYYGAPTTTTLFLSVVSKIAGFAVAIRVFGTVFHNEFLLPLLAAIAVISIVVGNFVGIIQVISRGSIKKLLAYSSIAQSGYLLVALTSLRLESVSSLLLYITIYALMNTAAFACVIHFERETGSDNIFDMAGLLQKKPMMAIVFVIALFNLAGLPFIPAGFIAKFFLFATAFSSGITYAPYLVIIALIGSVVALFYYLYVAKLVIVDAPSHKLQSIPDEGPAFDFTKLTAVLSTALLVIFSVWGMDFLQGMTEMAIYRIGV